MRAGPQVDVAGLLADLAREGREPVADPVEGAAAFGSGLNAASVTAGVTGMIAGALVLVLVRAPRPAAGGAEAPAETVVAAPRG
ncbi:hypothetical protein AB0D27_24110 [Streptomyces sp. NPDC048415]|uniref:hypothetical protein n=1 Tax=Streptomyces sp. NPDC048415 TaxID=3154822 RepID=UPI00343D86EC